MTAPDIVARLREGRLIQAGKPVSSQREGVTYHGNTGEVREKHPLGDEAADEIVRLRDLSEKHRAAGHQQRVGEEVVGLAGGRARQQGRCRGCHHNEVGLMAKPDVVDLVHVVEDAVADRIPGQGLPRGDTHEAGSRLSGNHRDIVSGFSKKPEERCDLVGRNPSPDSEDYAHVTSVNRQSELTLRLRSA